MATNRYFVGEIREQGLPIVAGHGATWQDRAVAGCRFGYTTRVRPVFHRARGISPNREEVGSATDLIDKQNTFRSRNDARVIGSFLILDKGLDCDHAWPPVVVRCRADHSAWSCVVKNPVDILLRLRF